MPWSIRRWLEDVGLPKYSDNFEHHDIAVDILPCLTKEDLEDLGVRTIGDRRRLFSAIKLLQIEAQEPLSKKTVAASRRPSEHRLERSRSRTLHDALSCAAPGSLLQRRVLHSVARPSDPYILPYGGGAIAASSS